jgi:hypothetical protein
MGTLGEIILYSEIFLFSSDGCYENFVLNMCRYGENEHPLDELIIFNLGIEHPNGCYNVSMCKIFGK